MKKQTRGVASCALIALISSTLGLTGCDTGGGRPTVSGTLKGAEGKRVYMDAMTLASQPVVCDSQDVASDGSFALRGQVQSEPAFYNIRLADGRSFNVVLDSAESVTLEADATAPRLAGSVRFDASPANDDLQRVMAGSSRLLVKLNDGTMTSADVSDFKSQLTDMVFANPRSMVGYYIVFQKIGGHPLFDVMDKRDHQLFSAVATSLQMAYPQSAQVKYLCDYVLGARAARKATARRDSLLQGATLLNSPNLALPDKDGTTVELTSLRGKTVLLFFWSSANEEARRAHAQLAALRKKYAGKNFEIYSVSFDTSKLMWEAATSGAEWVNVCDLRGPASPAAATYNVVSLPSNYILDPEGRLVGKDLFGARLDNKLSEILN